MFLRAPLTRVSGLFTSNSNSAPTNDYTSEQLGAAKTAAYAASPHVYQVILPDPATKLSFLVFGCQGNAKDAQKRVATLMNKMVELSHTSKPAQTAASAASTNHQAEETHDPANHHHGILFYIVLGDNFYDQGVQTPDDPAFESHYYQIYANKNRVPSLAALPAFVIQGNHDQGRWKTGEFTDQVKHEIGLAPTGLKGKDLGMNQIAHSYLGGTQRKQSLYNQSQLKLDELPAWNMPSRYYSLIIGNIQLFLIDSNTYASDYLQLIRGINVASDNQARWLKENVTAAKAAGRDVMLALHHPLFTPGKRAYNSDITLYLTSDEIEEAKGQFKESFASEKPPYNNLLWEMFKRQELTFKTVFAAHDHSLSYFNNRETCTNPNEQLCQIISAGAGGSLQQRRHFKHQDSMGCFLKKHGVVQVTFDPTNTKDIQFDVVAINEKDEIDNHITFSSEHCRPTRHFPATQSSTDINKMTTFFAIVKSAIDDYCAFLGEKQDEHNGGFFSRNLTHRDDGIDRVHELWAYISDSRTCRYGLSRIVNSVRDITSWQSTFSAPAKHSLITILNEKMMAQYSMTIDGLHLDLQQQKKLVR